MFFVIVGTLLVVLKFGDIAPVADWSWWLVLVPFGLAVLWWAYSDATGLTRRRAMQRMEDRKEERRRKAYEALGLDPRRASNDRKKAEEFNRAHDAHARKVEGKRNAVRQRHADTIAKSSQFHSQIDSTSYGDVEIGPATKK